MQEETSGNNEETRVVETAPVERSLLDKFADYLAEKPLARQVFMTASALFVAESDFPEFLENFQSWLKTETGSEGLLPKDRCHRMIFEKGTDSAYYLLDGKNCFVGYLVNAKPLDQFRNKFKAYPGIPFDGRKMLHPKDPFLTRLPAGVQVANGPNGQELIIKSDNIKAVFRLDDLPHLLGVFKGSPRLRRFKSSFQLALRDLIPEFSKLILSGQITDKSRLRIIPSRFRNSTNFSCLRLSDTYLIFDRDQRYLQSFGLKGKNLFDFISYELRSLLHSIRNRRIGQFELEGRNRRLAGTIKVQNEKFFMSVHSLLEWVQLCKMSQASTLYDYILAFSADFASSGWVLERDIPGRQKNFCKRNAGHNPQLNYRTSKQYLYAIDKRHEIVAIMRWVKPKQAAIELKPLPAK